MPKVMEGRLVSKGKKYALVVSRFNEFISTKLLDGALDALRRHGVKDDEITVAWTPGAFEIPVVAKRLAQSGDYNAVIALAAVIRGGTPHFNYIANEVAKGVSQAALETGVPILFGVLTTDTIEQAVERAGARLTNKGFEAALSAIEMVNVLKQL